MASNCVVGGRQNDCRVAVLFELADNLLSGEGAWLARAAQDLGTGVIDGGESERGVLDRCNRISE